eukprot:5310040-Amphidinium_carterae.1
MPALPLPFNAPLACVNWAWASAMTCSWRYRSADDGLAVLLLLGLAATVLLLLGLAATAAGGADAP